MIKSIALTRLQLGETNDLCIRIGQLIDKHPVTTPGFEQVGPPLQQSFKLFNDALDKNNTKQLSVDVKGADVNRDNAHIGTKLYIRAYTFSLDEEKVRAANLLLNLFEQYGNFHRESLANQTSKQDKLLQQLDTEPLLKEAIATIGVGQFIEEMRRSGDEFKMAAEARIKARANQNNDDASELAKNVHTNLRNLFQYLEVMLRVMPSPELEQLVAQINEVIDEVKQQLLIKEGRKIASSEELQN